VDTELIPHLLNVFEEDVVEIVDLAIKAVRLIIEPLHLLPQHVEAQDLVHDVLVPAALHQVLLFDLLDAS
jgi:hypothetical protein